MTDMSLIQRVCGRGSHLCCSSHGNFSKVCYTLESDSSENQLKSLHSYFGKLQDDAELSSFDSSNKAIQMSSKDNQSRLKNGLKSLDSYLAKLDEGANQECYARSTFVEDSYEGNSTEKPFPVGKDNERNYHRRRNKFVDIRGVRGDRGPVASGDSQQDCKTSDLYLIGILASINIGVFLFEIASPVRNSESEIFSLPSLYGAKINHLIVLGEWWRLITPMFLHSGIFHMALSFWSLLTFGPQVCRGYGSFTFLLIYILGGVSGNLTSFLHTAEPSVGGTGPVFAIIGAWLAYQIQNKDAIANDASETMFQKAITATVLGFILCNLGPIDEWTHFGAAFTGMAYGFFTSPILQLDDAPSAGTSQEEGLKLVRKYEAPLNALPSPSDGNVLTTL
ncbi:hypothetical protein L6164_007691 [Bauhinia variegata]|uniref:Uncharacterized protein n=1 Tax=Bauhinia variegata TaxID=167791 RepID=A0ACB9PE77_BAUVA|nr:hypothetical protein L6164_007691 [Bauhinia variegata]